MIRVKQLKKLQLNQFNEKMFEVIFEHLFLGYTVERL